MRALIEIIGLGPGRKGLVTAETLDLIDSVPVRIARTQKHPSIGVLERPCSDSEAHPRVIYCDDLYDTGENFAAVYAQVVQRVLDYANEYGRVIYAVPGSPRVAENAVQRLIEIAAEPDSEVEVVVHAAMSFLDLAWVTLGVDPVEDSVQIIDALALGEQPETQHYNWAKDLLAGPNPVLISQCYSKQVLSDIKLSVEEPSAGLSARVIQRLGTDDEAVFDVPWAELDRSFEPDHLTSIFVQGLGGGLGLSMQRFGWLVTRLREGCVWDARQTHSSLRRYLIEESYETLDALDALDSANSEYETLSTDTAVSQEVLLNAADSVERCYEDLCEELGDLLFQIFFHSEIASEAFAFDLEDVVDGVYEKLYSRHDHVFASEDLSEEELGQRWEQHKRSEKRRGSALDGIPLHLPALLRAYKFVSKASRLDIDFEAMVAKASEDRSIADSKDISLALLDIVKWARQSGLDPESALRDLLRIIEKEIRAAGL